MSGLFGGGGGSTQKLPEPPRMPSPGDAALREARNLQLQQTGARQGLLSTILSQNISQNVNGSRGALGA